MYSYIDFPSYFPISGRSTSSDSDNMILKERERERGRAIGTSELTFSPGSLQAARRATGDSTCDYLYLSFGHCCVGRHYLTGG